MVLGLFVFIACNKDDETPSNVPQYQISILSPNTDDKHQGDTLHIDVKFSEKNLMTVHHINVQMYNKNGINQVIFDQPAEAHIHETSGQYDFKADYWLDPSVVAGHSDWILRAKVWGHDDGVSEVADSIGFHVHPM